MSQWFGKWRNGFKMALGFSLLTMVATAGVAITGAERASAQTPKPQQWFKVCANQAEHEICNVQYRVVASSGQIIASVNLLQVKGKINRRIFQITVPTNRLIPAGVVVQIDKGKEKRIPYIHCFNNRCIAELKLDDNLVKILKNGGALSITSTNFQNKPTPIQVTLAGFTAAYDGPPLKPAEVEKQNEKLQEALRKKAEDARKKLLEEQNKAKQ